MKISINGLHFLMQEEGLRLKAYKDVGGIWTIGYGSTGKHVKPDSLLTKEAAVLLLQKDLLRFEQGVDKLVTVPINQAQTDALISFSFNLGTAALAKSSLLRYINAGKPYDPVHIVKLFTMWNKVNGIYNNAIYNRRLREARTFLS